MQCIYSFNVFVNSTLGSQYTYDYGFDENPVLTDEGINKIAKAFDASPSQVVLKWALENDVMVIPRSNTPNHIETNFNLHHVFLSDRDRQYFDSLDGKFAEDDNETEAGKHLTNNTAVLDNV